MAGIQKYRKPTAKGYNATKASAGLIGTMPSYGGLSSYDAVRYSSRRRQFRINNASEDKLLKQRDRDSLISTARAIRRNSSVLSWGIRRHLDNVAVFNFQCRCWLGDTPEARAAAKQIDWKIESYLEWWGRPLNIDAGGRHSLKQLIRMIEGHKKIDGDVFIYKIEGKDKDDPYRGTIQLIEGDRVRTPDDFGDYKNIKAEDFVNGVRVDPETKKPLAYAICERIEANGVARYRLAELVSAADVFHYGCFDRYDQYRGISPLSAALNSLTDISEAQEYALAKMKIAQICALALTRGAESMPIDGSLEPLPTEVGTTYVDGAGQPIAAPPIVSDSSIDLMNGPQVVELENGDKADFLTADTPGTEFQAFLEKVIGQILKTLDIPYSFYDEAYTNYSGARQALLQYQLAAEQQRDELRILLNQLFVWRISLAIADGEIELPDGMRISDINWKWVGNPMPWIDPQKEAMANKLMVDNKFTSRQRICADNGRDFFEVMDELAAEEAYAKEIGVALLDTPVAVQEETDDEEDPDYVDPVTGKPSGRNQRK